MFFVERILKNLCLHARHRWLTPVILPTWEPEIRRIEVRGQLRQIIQETPSPK
jgi:hypothetical protein